MHVGLIRPPIVHLPKSLSSFGAIPPIGLAYVAAALEEAGHLVEVVDGAGESLDSVHPLPGPERLGNLEIQGLSVEAIVNRLGPETQVVGITHMFLHEWPLVKTICESVRSRFPKATIVLGGENASAFWPWVFQLCSAVDHVVLNEGEDTIVELMERLSSGQSVEGMSGLVWRNGEHGQAGERRDRIVDLDNMARPAWHLFPIDNYMNHADNHGVHRGRAMPILATRGCPYRCTFCSSPDMWTTRYVTRDPEEVVDEIETYVEEYGVQNLNFCDLTAILKRKWILAFCEALESRGLNVTWQLPSGTRSEVLDREVLERMYATGARNVTYNPETGSPRMLEIFKKRVKLDRMMESLKEANDIGMVTRTCYIVGHPKERRRDLLDTAKQLVATARAGVDDASVMVFGPFPGSEDFEELIHDEQLQIDDDYFYLALARSGRSLQTWHPTRSTQEIVATQLALMVLFYGVAYASHPQKLMDRARAMWSGEESSAVDQLLRVKMRQLASRATH
ncbi:MAG: radical SAM protein [Myxococcota bacterium]|nr:radical SAM protein [Myxococcota bacterium]